MKNFTRVSAICLAVIVIIVQGCNNTRENTAPEAARLTDEQLVQRGEYLVMILGCHDCHSPKNVNPEGRVVIQEVMLSGYPAQNKLADLFPDAIKAGWAMLSLDGTAAACPWGISFAANISSDQTGIGNFTEEMFRKSFMEGKYKGQDAGRTLLPPMPWPNYTKAAAEDVKAIYKYLLSTKPVRNVVPLSVAPGDMM